MWYDLSHHLQNIHPAPVSEHEKVFGVSGNTPNVILRNWMTFLLRQCIVEHESIAFHNKKGQGNEILIKNSYNQMIKSEVWLKYNIFCNLGRLEYFERMFSVNDYLIEKINGEWEILTLYQT